MKTQIKTLDPRTLKLLDLNARYMTHEQFHALVANIKRDGKLTSVPFAYWNGEAYEVLSGNHRTKAAIAAGLETIDVMTTDDKLTREETIAIQLSHNAIAGQDDPAMLKRLYEEIQTVDLKLYAGLDDKTLQLLTKVSPIPFSEAGLESKMLSVIFLPNELAQAQSTIDTVLAMAQGDKVWLARYAQYDAWLDAIATAGAAAGISNSATALMVVLGIFDKHMEDLETYLPEAKPASDFPLAALLGSDRVRASTAKLLKGAINRLRDQGLAKTPQEAIELMAKSVLAA